MDRGKVHPVKNHVLSITLAMLLIPAAMVNAGCAKRNHTADVTFEPRPRAVLETLGLQASWDPRLEVDTAGTLYLFAVYDQGSKSRLGLAMSENSGDTITPPVLPISEPDVSVGSHGEQSPSVVMTRAEIYALWQELGADGSSKIMSARSLTWGETFDAPRQVSDKGAPLYRGFPSISVSPNGDVYAAWLDERDASKPDQETSSVYLAKSTDRGATFGKNVRVADQTCPCCRPSLAFDANGQVFVAWRRVFPGEIRDIVVSTSQNGGETFAPPVRVHEDGWKIDGCPDSGPVLAESNSSLWIAWMTAGTNNRARILLSHSDDGGQAFKDPVVVSGNVVDANHPTMKAGKDGTLWLVFQGRTPSTSGNWNKSRAYLVQIDRYGNSSQPFPIPGSNNSISYPKIAIGNEGQLFLAWTQPQGDHFTVMLSRGRERK